MKLSYYSWAGYGFLVASLFGVSRYGWSDYRTMGLAVLAVSLLLVDVVRSYRKSNLKK